MLQSTAAVTVIVIIGIVLFDGRLKAAMMRLINYDGKVVVAACESGDQETVIALCGYNGQNAIVLMECIMENLK